MSEPEPWFPIPCPTFWVMMPDAIPSSRPRPVLRVLLVAVALLVLLAGFDLVLGAVANRTRLLEDVVDIQSPATLFAKIDYFSRFDGLRVVFLGDSVVYGGTLREHNDRRWRRHNPARLLRNRLEAEFPGRKVCVMNLGLNGALPADLEQVARLMRNVRVDLWLFDVNLRSFSADFASPSALLSRPWLSRLDLADGRFHLQPGETWSERLETGLSSLLVNTSSLVRMHDFLQFRTLEGPPADRLRALRNRWSKPDNSGLDGELLLLLKARQRFDSITLKPDHPQRQALERLLGGLVNRRQKVVVFYARENPEVLEDLIERNRYKDLTSELRRVVEQYPPETVAYVPGVEAIPPESYLDHVHVDFAGYRILIEHLWPEVRRLLAR